MHQEDIWKKQKSKTLVVITISNPKKQVIELGNFKALDLESSFLTSHKISIEAMIYCCPFQDELSPRTTNHLMKEKGRNVTTKIFCSDTECVDVFDHERDLKIHLNLEKHSYTNQTDERHSTNDKVKILFAKKLKEASFSRFQQQETVVHKRAKQATMKKRKKKGKVNQKDTGDSFEGMGNQMG